MKKARKQNIDTASNNNENNSNNVKISSLTPRDIRNYFPYKNHWQDYLDNDCSNENSIYPKFPPYNRYYHEFMRSRVNGGGGHPWHYLNNCNDCDRDEDYNKHLKNINHLHNEYDKFKYTSYDYYEQNYDNDNCDQDRKLATGQIDLLRLLILFVALRPRCPYLTHICRIADEQFQVLIQLLN